jgi:hypothetical protein
MAKMREALRIQPALCKRAPILADLAKKELFLFRHAVAVRV